MAWNLTWRLHKWHKNDHNDADDDDQQILCKNQTMAQIKSSQIKFGSKLTAQIIIIIMRRRKKERKRETISLAPRFFLTNSNALNWKSSKVNLFVCVRLIRAAGQKFVSWSCASDAVAAAWNKERARTVLSAWKKSTHRVGLWNKVFGWNTQQSTVY